MPFTSPDFGTVPGSAATLSEIELALTWGPATQVSLSYGITVDASTVDARSAVTSELQIGLLMGKITATGKYKQYAPSATDGTQLVQGALGFPVKMIDSTGATRDMLSHLMIGGKVRNAALGGLDGQSRQQMANRFIFDDDLPSAYLRYPWLREISKTGNYTVLPTDTGTLFDTTGNAGAITFTLPALGNGLHFGFLNTVGQNMTVQRAGADTIIGFNNASAVSAAFTTAGNLIGAMIMVYANPAATKWLVQDMSAGANTITYA